MTTNLSFVEVDPFNYLVEFNQLMKNGGLLLVTEGIEKKPNIMIYSREQCLLLE